MTNPIALNTITIKQVGDLREKIEIAAEAEYDGVGLWAGDLAAFLEGGGELAEVKDMLEENGLSVPEVCFVGGWMGVTAADRKQALAEAKRAFQHASEIGAYSVIACAAGHQVDIADAAKDYSLLCDVAADFGVVPALEFLGGAATVKDVKTAAEVVARADHELGGILLDTFHFYRGGSEPEDILAIRDARVAMVHANDAAGAPRFEMNDLHRVYCGEGEIPLEAIFTNLREVGYRQAFSVEIFNEEYWASDPMRVAQKARVAIDEVLARL